MLLYMDCGGRRRCRLLLHMDWGVRRRCRMLLYMDCGARRRCRMLLYMDCGVGWGSTVVARVLAVQTRRILDQRDDGCLAGLPPGGFCRRRRHSFTRTGRLLRRCRSLIFRGQQTFQGLVEACRSKGPSEIPEIIEGRLITVRWFLLHGFGNH